MKYSCIIPVYNEQPRILEVLKTIIQVKKISEIICIDDGSTDDSFRIIQKNFPQINLVGHRSNLGKTSSIITGLNLAKNETVLLLDSDLIKLKSSEIDNAFACFEQNKLDCLLLNTAPMSFIDKLLRFVFRFLLLAAGNRIIQKQLLKEILKPGNFQSYHLEMAQNKYLMENNKNVAYYDISALDVSKISKEGFIKGLLDELEMWRQIMSYAGLFFFIKQSFVLARKKVHWQANNASF